MIRDTYQNIIDGIDLRQNLILLKNELKEENNKFTLLYHMGTNREVFINLLSNDDAKVRKNAAIIMGNLALPEYLGPLYTAYEKETQLFVKSAYLAAIKEFDFREYLPNLKLRLEELSNLEITEESKKHVMEEIRALSDLIIMMEGINRHQFSGYEVPSDFVLLTNRNHINVTIDQLVKLPNVKVKEFNAGVMGKASQLREILNIRTFQEILFLVEGMKTCPMDPIEAAKTIAHSKLMEFLSLRHEGEAPFYFRIELKSKMELDKKSAFIRRLASEIEQLTMRKLINTTSSYEFEIRLIENKEGKFNVMIKLYTLEDQRFSYRKEVVATSIQPANAALMVELIRPYMKESAKILDPFCGVGTMLIERHKVLRANTMYGLDKFGEAIEKARENTSNARQIIHYIQRDYFDFRHEYTFDEIITNMPMQLGKKQEREIHQIYQNFFEKSKEHLNPGGYLFLYSHDRDIARKYAKGEYRLVKEFEINRVEGAYILVIQYKE